MNNVCLVGRLTRDPELRTVNTMNGTNTTCSFTIAVSRQFTNQNGERDADFINCVIWGKQAENLCRYCTKGAQIGVQGRIQTRNYQNQEGNTVYVTEVAATNVTFLTPKNSNGTSSFDLPQVNSYSNNNQNMSSSSNRIETNNEVEDPFKDFGSEVVLNDDDLPF